MVAIIPAGYAHLPILATLIIVLFTVTVKYIYEISKKPLAITNTVNYNTSIDYRFGNKGGENVTNLDLAKLKKLRKSMKLSQHEMAAEIGLMSAKVYHEREAGKVKFSADELAKLAFLFGVDIASLYTENFFATSITDSVTEQKGA
jgi:DNA-binding XRE family transcriptional regulator